MNFDLPIEANYKGSAKHLAELEKALAELLEREAKNVLARIRSAMRSPKTGKIYITKYGTYQASAPGEAPARKSGRLLGSLRARKSNRGLRIRITAEVAHGKFMEYGTKKKLRKGYEIAPRPFMGPAKEQARPVLLKDARALIKQKIQERNR